MASSGHSSSTMNTSLLHSNRRKALWASGALALAGAFAAGAQSGNTNNKPAVEVKRDTHVVNRGALENASFSSVVKRVSPSVVKITTETKAKRVSMRGNGNRRGQLPPGFEDNPMLRQFFGGNMPDFEQQQPAQSGL